MSITKVRQFLDEKGYDGLLIRKKHNFAWVTGGRQNHIVLTTEEGVADCVIFPDRVYVVTTKMEARRIWEEELAALPFEVELISDDWYRGTDHLIAELTTSKRMATDTPYRHFDHVEEQLGQIRSVLTEREIGSYRELCQQAAQAVEGTCREIRPGQTEHEIAAALSQKVIAQGARVQVALVATDERIVRYRHPIPTDKRLEKQAMVVLCAERGGLVANVTRLVHFGRLSKELIENKERLARIDVCMNAATRPGVRVGDIVQAGIAQYEREGFPEDWKYLHQGGVTGFQSREYLATPDAADTVVVHQAYAWNPALRGVKSEDTMLVCEEENEFLTHTGEWDYIEVDQDGRTYLRPDILVR